METVELRGVAVGDASRKGQLQNNPVTDIIKATNVVHQSQTGENRQETNLENSGGGGAGASCSSEIRSQVYSNAGNWPLHWNPPLRAVQDKQKSVAAVVPKERPFKCSQCGKTFRFNSALKKHELVHTGAKPHKCCECGKGFQFVSDLRKHTVIHSGERPYRCSICGKGFVDVSNFRRHERIHTGEKPFSCPFCEKDFTDKGNVKKHMRVHTGEKPFSCPVCKKEFSFLASYKRHVRIHRAAVQSNTDSGM